MNKMLLYDGKCGLCSFSVKLISKFDRKNQISKISLDSEFANDLITEYDIPSNIESAVFITKDSFYLKSNAIIEALASCNKLFGIFKIFKLIPVKWRDYIYDFIAKHRKKVLGENNSCELRN